MIIDKEKFIQHVNNRDDFHYSKLKHNYTLFFGHIDEIESSLKYADEFDEEDKVIAQLAVISILAWGYLSISSIDDSKRKNNYEQSVYTALTQQISNTLLCIFQLSANGLDMQAGVLQRSLYELTSLFLTVHIDKSKMRIYFDSAKLKNTDMIWKKHFTLGKMNEVISKWEVGFSDELKFMSKIRKKNYSYYSKFTHSSFFEVYSSCFAYQRSSDKMLRNPWGVINDNSRMDNFIGNANQQMWIVSKIYLKLYGMGNINRKMIVNDKDDFNRELWNDGTFLLFLFVDLYEDIIMRKIKKLPF